MLFRMLRFGYAAVIALVLAHMTGMPNAASALSVESREKLKAGGYVILMRHALTDGTGDPAGFVLRECATQRNLNAEGKAQATAQGLEFAAAGIPISRVMSSPWCRCIDTARLVAPGLGVEKRLELGSYLNVSTADRRAPTAEMREEIEAWKGPGNLLMVSHQINIGDLIDRNIAQGAYVILDPKGRKVIAVEK